MSRVELSIDDVIIAESWQLAYDAAAGRVASYREFDVLVSVSVSLCFCKSLLDVCNDR